MELSTKRHSLSHIMAQAVKQNFPNAKIATGPDTTDGFYYDFDFGETSFGWKRFEENPKYNEKNYFSRTKILINLKLALMKLEKF